MNLLQSVVLFICLLVSQPVKAQWRLIYKSQDIDSVWLANKTAPVDAVNPIRLIERRGELSKYLIVRYARSKRKLINKNNVWGFTDSTNAVWRYSNGDFCRVVDHNGAWIEYAIYRTNTTRYSKPVIYYTTGYSRTLDSKIEASWDKAMEDVPVELIFRKGKK